MPTKQTPEASNGKIIDRVRKLLKMARDNADGGEHERDNAMRMAQKLIMKHNLEPNQYEDTSERELSTLRIDVCPWRRVVCLSIAGMFFVKMFSQKVGVQTLQISFIGAQGNSVTAKEMSHYLILALQREAAKQRKEKFGDAKGQASRWETSFLNAAAQTIARRCEEIMTQNMADLETENASAVQAAGGSAALVVSNLNNNEMESNLKYIDEVMGLKLKSAPMRFGAWEDNGVRAGNEHGKTVSLNRQVS